MSENKRESFIFYSSFDETLREMSEKDELAARRAICDYAFKGIEPDKKNIIVRIFFKSVKPLLDRSYQNYLNGKNGGRPKKTEPKPNQNPVETELKPNGNQPKTEPKPNQNRTETPLSNDKDNDKDNDKNLSKDLKEDIPPCIPPLKEGNDKTEDKPAEKNKRFVKPHIDEINAFCDENDIVIDTEAFYDYFESKGWTVGKAPMKDWKAAVRNWYRRQSPETTAKLEKENNPTSFDELYELTMKKLAAKQAAQKEHEPITGQQKAEINQITNSLFKSPDAGKPAANDDFKHYRGF